MIFTVTNTILVEPPGDYGLVMSIQDAAGTELAKSPPTKFTVAAPTGVINPGTPEVKPAVTPPTAQPK